MRKLADRLSEPALAQTGGAGTNLPKTEASSSRTAQASAVVASASQHIL